MKIKAMKLTGFLLALWAGLLTLPAQLVVTVLPPKITGSKAVVPLALKNNFAESVTSARAALFLLDERGKMVGQSTHWIIGNGKSKGLPAGGTNAFFFVVTEHEHGI